MPLIALEIRHVRTNGKILNFIFTNVERTRSLTRGDDNLASAPGRVSRKTMVNEGREGGGGGNTAVVRRGEEADRVGLRPNRRSVNVQSTGQGSEGVNLKEGDDAPLCGRRRCDEDTLANDTSATRTHSRRAGRCIGRGRRSLRGAGRGRAVRGGCRGEGGREKSFSAAVEEG